MTILYMIRDVEMNLVQEDDVREYWSYCGEIEDIDLMRFPDTGRFKGIAFITFVEVWLCNLYESC